MGVSEFCVFFFLNEVLCFLKRRVSKERNTIKRVNAAKTEEKDEEKKNVVMKKKKREEEKVAIFHSVEFKGSRKEKNHNFPDQFRGRGFYTCPNPGSTV